MKRMMLIKKQNGFSLLEALLALAIMGYLSLSVPAWYEAANKEPKQNTAATLMQRFCKALSSYQQNNAAALLAVATTTTPATVTVPMLIATGDLPTGFSTTNSYGASLQGQFLQPQVGVLQGVAMGVGGNDPGELDAGIIAAKLGAKGGRVTSVGTAIGAYGGWSLSLAGYTNPGTNRILAYLNMDGAGSASDSDSLRRHAVAGHPEYNSMYTPINMRAVAVENTSDTLCIVGDATTYGRIAADNVGAVLSCQAGIWKKQGSGYWKDPVATFASLPTTDQVGSVRMTLDKARGYMWDGVKWDALAVDQNDNLSMTGIMTAGKVQLKDIVTEGTACPTNGLVARDTNGLTLSCQNGVWKSEINASSPSYYDVSGYWSWGMTTPQYRLCTLSVSGTTFVTMGGGLCMARPNADNTWYLWSGHSIENGGTYMYCQFSCFN